MHVYSGKCRVCDVGIPTGFQDAFGKHLYTGDIVISYTVDDSGFSSLGSLTVVVGDQYTSYTNGTHVETDKEPEFYVMGIKSVPLDGDDIWKVLKVKGFESVIDGEKWPEYGFSFRCNSNTEESCTPSL